jgi:ATP-dependent helicase/nuclease subunit A
VTDSAARERARTRFDHPLLVEAGAGTGKTTTLVARICTWCLGPGWEERDEVDPGARAAAVLEGVVAITFTEAAAAGMASRVAEAWVAVAQGADVQGLPVRGTPETRARARALLGAADRLTATTIHAWCSRILAAAPAQAGLHPEHAVDGDGSLLAEVVHEEVVDWLVEALARDDEVRDALLFLAGRGVDTEQLAEATLKLASEAHPSEALAGTAYPADAVRSLSTRLTEALDPLLGHLHDKMRDATDAADARALLAALSRLRQTASRLRAAGDLAGLVLAAEGVPEEPLAKWSRRKFTRLQGHQFAGVGPDPAREKLVLDRVASAAAGARRAVEHVLSLQPDLCEAGRRVLHPLLARVRERVRRRGIVTFAQILAGARDLLRDHPDVAARVRGGIRQLLVDEFQDTDAVQCDLVRMVALQGEARPGLFVVGDPKQSIYGWRSADLRAYDAFKAELLAAGGERLDLVVNHRSVPAILDEVERVVEPVMVPEDGFQPAFQRLLPHRSGAEGATAVEYWVADEPGRERLASGDVAALEADAVAADIAAVRARTGVAWDRFGLLLRSTTELDRFLDAMRRAGIPYVVERDRQYFRRRDIIEAVAVVRCILDPTDALAMLTVLRSPLVGVPDAALVPLWRADLPARLAAPGGEHHAAVLAEVVRGAAAEVRRSSAIGITHVAGWDEALLETARAIARLRLAYEALPADAFVARIRALLPLEQLAATRHLGAYRVANLQRFWQELEEELARRPGDPQGVLRSLRAGIAGRREAEEARPPVTAARAVRVMTIHKAKGLDFDHVYVPQLHKGRRPGRAPARGDACAVHPTPDGWEYCLFGARTGGYDRVAAYFDRVEVLERVRLLYVAMTRAKERLVMSGQWPPDDVQPVEAAHAASLLDLLLSRKGGIPEPARAHAGAVRHDGATWRIPPRSGPTAPGPAEAEAPRLVLFTDEKRAASARMARPLGAAASAAAHDRMGAAAPRAAGGPAWAPAIGTAVHAALETMNPREAPGPALERGREEVARVLAAGVAEEDRPAAQARAEALLAGFVRGALGARFRAIAAHILGREVPTLAAPADDRGPVGFYAGAIDLLYLDPESGEAVVADFKTDAVSDPAVLAERVAAYTLQLAHYADVVRGALGRPVRAELWFLAVDRVVDVTTS